MNNFQCKYIPNIAVKVSTIKKKIVLIVFWNSNFSGYPMFSLLTLSCLYPIPKRSSSLSIFSSVQFSYSVLSDSLQPHRLQHARPPCPSPTPGVYPNSYHWVSDAIQPSHPLSSSYPLTFNLSQHQGLFQWVSSSHQVAKVLEFQLQHPSFQWIFRTDFL